MKNLVTTPLQSPEMPALRGDIVWIFSLDMFPSIPLFTLAGRPFSKTGRQLPSLLFVVLVFLIFLPALAIAQKFTTNVSANKIGKNQFAQVTYEIADAEKLEDFQAPFFRDWQIVSGPSNSSFQSNYNGKISTRTSISFYLQPKHPGRLLIEGAKAVIDGKLMTSSTAMVEVQNKTVNDPGQQAGSTPDPFASIFDDPFATPAPPQKQSNLDNEFQMAQVIRPGEDAAKKITDNVMLKVVTSKNSCYEGEPIVATYKIYTRLDLANPDFAKRPSFSGFSAYDLDEGNQRYDIEAVNGKNYRVYTYRKVQLYPLQSGTLTLDPVELDFSVKLYKYEMIAAGDFDANNSDNYIQKTYALKSEPTNITVLPLPAAGRPADFKGAVGDFLITAATEAPEAGKDDANILHVKITGSGNFSMVHAPAVVWPKSVETYDPEEKEQLQQTLVPIGGEKDFKYVFLCHQPGIITIPPISFSYFDITAKAYKTITTESLQVKILPQSRQPRALAPAEGTNLPMLFTSIARYVLPVLAILLVVYLLVLFIIRRKKKAALRPQHTPEQWDQFPASFPVQSLPPAAAAPAVVHAPAVDPGAEKYMPLGLSTLQQQTAPEQLTPGLPNAEEALWMPDHKTFYLALKSDLLQAMATALSQVATNRSALMLALQQKGTDSSILQQIGIILDECEAAIYSPVYNDSSRMQTMEEARYLISRI